MDAQSPLEGEVRALRLAAEQRDWNACQHAAEALLLRLPMSHAVRLTRDFVARRLPAFERHHLGVCWPRELLEVVGGKEPASSERIWPEEDEFAGPGGNNFKGAVESLWSASLRMDDARACTAELVDALTGAIMAELVEHWGARHPEEWTLWYQLALSGDGDPRMGDIQIAMMKAPDVQRLKQAAWLEVADSLEAALRESAGSTGGSGRGG